MIGNKIIKAITPADVHLQDIASLVPSKFNNEYGLVTIGFDQDDRDHISDVLLSSHIYSITSIANFSDNLLNPNILIPIRIRGPIVIYFDLTILIFGLSGAINNLGVTVAIHEHDTYGNVLQSWDMDDWNLKIRTDSGKGSYEIGYPKILKVTGFIDYSYGDGSDGYSMETNLLSTNGLYYELNES